MAVRPATKRYVRAAGFVQDKLRPPHCREEGEAQRREVLARGHEGNQCQDSTAGLAQDKVHSLNHVHSRIHSHTRQFFIMHSMCARHRFRHWGHGSEEDSPSLELTFQWGS